MLKLKFSFAFFILFSLTTFSQLSKKHFIPPLTYAESGNANPNDQYFYISTPKTGNISFKIKKIGSSDDINGVVSRTNPQIISLQNGEGQLFVDSKQTSRVHKNKGYIIEADDVIYVSVRMNAGSNGSNTPQQAGALVSKGAAALGKTFRAGMYTNENPQTNYLNFISVMATENNTIVNFNDLPTGISIKNSSNNGTSQISIPLNEGESYVVATNAADNVINRDGLIGTLITSDKEIVVNAGSANGSFGDGGGRDYGLDQIVDVSKVGTEYIFVRGNKSALNNNDDKWENVLIVAHEDNTDIFVNGNTTPITNIDAGEYYSIEGDNYDANNNVYVQTSKKVFAYQGIGGLDRNENPNEANQGMFFVPPLSCENRKAVINIPNIDKIGNILFKGGITIVTNKTAEIKVNSTILNIADSKPVTGNLDYVTYKILGLDSDVIIESTDELYCAYFNYNGSASSGSFYSGFPSNPEINFDTNIATTGNCIGNKLKLKATNSEIFDEFEWFFDDGTGFKTTNNKTTEIEPQIPGRYQLRTKIICDGAVVSKWNSTTIPVSICPDDYDNDGIIDNVDDDIDNDGILNCDESLGNIDINFADISNPIVSGNLTTITSNFTQDNSSLNGEVNGNFTSTVNASSSESTSTYKLIFNQKINLKITQQSKTTHTAINDEYYVLRISPSNKNITLLDPDNQLLIASDFENFKSGITQISASEIWFKFASTTSASTFQFVANQVNELTFEHHSKNATSSSIFNGNIQLACFTRDSDRDGIEDMFDLDSDNDGIPDLNETGNDTDGDSVPNYLDLDSDNDGILDTTESRYNLYTTLDTNFDGIINNFIDANNNGIIDDVENDTSIKTLSLNYTIIDSDADTIFNFLEKDSDNDECFDVTEAGFTDDDNDGIFGAGKPDVETNGKLKNHNYTNPVNDNYVTFVSIPEFSVDGEAPNNPIIICPKNIPFTLKVQGSLINNYDYKWTDEKGTQIDGNTQEIQISEAGKYTVTAFSRNPEICPRQRTIVVQKSNFDTLNESFITITDDTSSNNSNLNIQIDIPTNPLINEEFQYALENEKGIRIRPFQDSNIFNDIEGGIYKILVENKNGCGASELVVSVLQLPKFFTPNEDGINDVWEIKGANKNFYQTSSNIQIFNRFGKLIAQIKIDGQGWNGTYKGKKLPASDYWYSIQLIPTDNSKTTINKKGHFSLLDN